MSIKYAILGILSWKPSTGYEIKKIFEESSSMYWSGNNNQIYKALIQLHNEELVTNETKHNEGTPSKKIYTITKEGINELKEWIVTSSESPEFKKPFLIQLAWSNMLTEKELFEILMSYENEIKVQLILQQEKAKRRKNFPDRTKRESLIWDMIDENMISSYKNELEWIRNLIKKLYDKAEIEENTKFQYATINKNGSKYIKINSSKIPLRTEQDALELLALCGENETNLLMIQSSAISEDFFKMKTGVAGTILQKFSNYSVKAAVIVEDQSLIVGKFKELVTESNKGNQFRVTSDAGEAEKWLCNN